jgi:hypothetical protein
MAHWSSCAVHNAPALPVGECDCEGYLSEAEGYAASLRQMAQWCEEYPHDVDRDELLAAADFIERQTAMIGKP